MGLVFCGVAYFTAHGTQLALFNQAIQQLNNPQQPFPEAHRRWLTLARWSCLLSLAFFVGGSVFAVFGLIGVHK